MIESALDSLRRGEFILLYDSAGRENEVDMVVAAEHATPEHVSRMRRLAGGLLCTAVGPQLASGMGLRYMHDVLAESGYAGMALGTAPYGDRPSFSISVNHRDTYTGITDRDRALTIRGIGGLAREPDPRAAFLASFNAPGHVPLLAAAPGMLAERRGHTEMSVYLAGLAGLSPAAAVCEMLDAQTYAALSVEGAAGFAREHGVPLVDGEELLAHARVRRN
ncbi:MAG: 3,4-dihydroxy-2-butanone-4-phosphate synthase [Nitrosopumilus sp.]|nr:3,4-dihydroxy-2-butanone-4-phosphate synthase [Nitrosopumilus sp.]CAI9831863.1 3,4-dihydroxy-2-butanone 4-phosphate synthase [Nitrosopumilaceae archaeon]MDA7943792.1 3,4-dihydroxy-2-butanone-4-phosphate synthase [Nitrosopumilus sp.]MDA7945154.1 3,4-dihydroxy-2-butanone-4-phosphate synthase [Nitrosopumilus sp.]MDA7953640.1 3,4-dihydroxy-2-butanone-4-phosphate synthase [Nitrosopumilus sp.]